MKRLFAPHACPRCGYAEPEHRCLDVFLPALTHRQWHGAQCQLEDHHQVHVHQFKDRLGNGVAWDNEGNVARLGR